MLLCLVLSFLGLGAYMEGFHILSSDVFYVNVSPFLIDNWNLGYGWGHAIYAFEGIWFIQALLMDLPSGSYGVESSVLADDDHSDAFCISYLAFWKEGCGSTFMLSATTVSYRGTLDMLLGVAWEDSY